MANRFIIRHGQGAPSPEDLETYELGIGLLNSGNALLCAKISDKMIHPFNYLWGTEAPADFFNNNGIEPIQGTIYFQITEVEEG